MAKTKPLKLKTLSYFGMFEGWFWIYVFMFSIDIFSHRLAYVFMHAFLFVLLQFHPWKLPTLLHVCAISIQTKVVCLYFMNRQLCIKCMNCIIISSLNLPCGYTWEWITIIKKELKSVTQRLLVSMKKNSHTGV